MADHAIQQSFDYIIVGGGVAGLTVAARIQKRLPRASVLVVEAGDDPSTDSQVMSASGAYQSIFGPYGWGLDVEPNKNLGGRAAMIHVGKALSGSAAINAGIWTRGPASDYDHWSQLVEDPAWSYQSMLPYFRMTENDHGTPKDEEQHGYEGPVHVWPMKENHPARSYPLRENIKTAWEQSGVKYIRDANSGHPVGLSELPEVWVAGDRQLPNKFLDLSKVKVMSSAVAHRLIIQTTSAKPTVVGIELIDGQQITATKEVILSCGSLHTPKLLMLSGIGPSSMLQRHGIPVSHDNPNIGQNLADHPSVSLTWKVNHPENGVAIGSPLFNDPSFANGWPGDFVYYGNIPEAKSQQEVNIMDYVLYLPALMNQNCPMDGSYINSTSVLVSPSSRGSVTLRSSQASDPPIIDENFNDTPHDRTILREGMRQMIRLFLGTAAGQSIVSHEVPPPGYVQLTMSATDEDLDVRVCDFGNTLYHPMGTCAMGKVVDSKCKLIGVEGLRVVDASVIPVAMGANTQACVYALAERAADFIVQGV